MISPHSEQKWESVRRTLIMGAEMVRIQSKHSVKSGLPRESTRNPNLRAQIRADIAS